MIKEDFELIKNLLENISIEISDQFPAIINFPLSDQNPIVLDYIKMNEVRMDKMSVNYFQDTLQRKIDALIKKLEDEKFYKGTYSVNIPNLIRYLKGQLIKLNKFEITEYHIHYNEPIGHNNNHILGESIQIKKRVVNVNKLEPNTLAKLNQFTEAKVIACEYCIKVLQGLIGRKSSAKTLKKKRYGFEYNGSLENLRLFHERLLVPRDKKGAFIADIEYLDFRRIFNNQETETKINWIGHQNELHFLIDRMLQNQKFENISQRWVMARKCFTFQNMPIEIQKLKDADDEPQRRLGELIKIIGLLD